MPRTHLGCALSACLVAMPAVAQDNGAGQPTPDAPPTAQDRSQAPEGAAQAQAGDGQGDGAAPSADPSTVVATVNGTDITLGHMIVLGERLPAQYQQLEPQALFDGILDQLVQQTAIGDGMEGEPGPRVELILENERRALLATNVLERLAEEAVTDEAVQAAYEETYGGGEPVTQYNASHILVEEEARARELTQEARGEGADFAALARENSTGPSGPNGGNLGWFSRGMMVEPFQDAVEGLETGQVSDPVQTQFGWHVIRLNETREQEPPGLEQVRSEIEAQLRQEAVQGEIDAAMEAAEVERSDLSGIDPAVIKNGDVLPN